MEGLSFLRIIWQRLRHWDHLLYLTMMELIITCWPGSKHGCFQNFINLHYDLIRGFCNRYRIEFVLGGQHS
jgi:hypothetical protein